MLGVILRKVFGTKNERELKRLHPIVEEIHRHEPSLRKLTDVQLRAKTEEFRNRYQELLKEQEHELNRLKELIAEAVSSEEKLRLKSQWKKLHNQILSVFLPQAYAVVKEACRRLVGMKWDVCDIETVWNMVPFDVQLMGAVVLHEGKIAEMATGEGKTLVATMPAYLNALTGRGVHIVTVNDYLARRDRQWMGPVYEFLGLKVGVIQSQMNPEERKEQYACDIVYGTNNEFGFDYLRDNMAIRKEDQVQRELHYAIIDEVDSILIDEARTPLIISGPAEESTELYYRIDRIIPRLKRGTRDEMTKEETGDYIVDEKNRAVYLTEEGELKAAKLLGLDNLHSIDNIEYKHHIIQALRAHKLFTKDRDYVVKEGQVLIVDEFTGRLLPGRRYSEGLHQALEAKERVKIERENQTLATITFQNYFRLYDKIAGMTGTAATEAEEFHKIYGLDVVVIPTNKPLRRDEYPDVIYKTEKEALEAVIKEVMELHEKGRPVLVGTLSIEKSEKISKLLQEEGIPHEVLNAKHHEREAKIIAKAGQRGAVTIATQMAGRGTDIVLGEGVADLGGLHIIGVERHEARRIDNQLRGRAGRQGDPGSSRFYLSLEDDLLRIFGSDRIKKLMEWLKVPEGQPIEHPWITKAIENAQKKMESQNFDIRKNLLEFDDVMNRQREVIYHERQMVLGERNLKNKIREMFEDVLEEKMSFYTPEAVHPEEWDLPGLLGWVRGIFPLTLSPKEIKSTEISCPQLKEQIMEEFETAYKTREEDLGSELLRQVEKAVLLQVIDRRWKNHLYDMDHLREGIGLRAYGQRDPLIEYKREGFALFQEMIKQIKEEVVGYIFKIQVSPEGVRMRGVFSLEDQELSHPEHMPFAPPREQVPEVVPVGTPQEVYPSSSEERPLPYRREGRKIGRNDPCPCGSGKKYKKCCGRFKT